MLGFVEGSLEAKLPTIWTDEKQSREEAERRERLEERRVRRVRRKKMQMREKVRKSQNTCVFPMIWGSGGSKSRLAKAAGAEPAGQMRDEKLHAVVARSTFRSQNVQNTWCSEHFWKLRCPKSARRFGAKHISKSKCTRHTILGPLLEVQMSKKCTPCGTKHISKSNVQNTPCTHHFWRLRCRFAWQAQGIVHLVKSDQNVRVL